MRLITIHPTNNAQLANVVAQMEALGSPTIRAVACNGFYFAIEGTHRIEAARMLALPVFLELCDEHALIDVAELDIAVNWDNVPSYPIPAKAVVEVLQGECNGEYMLSGDGMVSLVRPAKYPPIPPPDGLR